MRLAILTSLACFFLTCLSAQAENRLSFVFGDDVPKPMHTLIEETAGTVATYFEQKLEAPLPDGTTIYASGEAKFLAAQYMANRGIRGGSSRWVRTWANQREAEGVYGAVFIRTSAANFNTDYGVGIKRQRQRVIAHELFHVLQYDLVGPRARNCCEPNSRIPVVGPIWLMEGSAQYIMYRFEHDVTGGSYVGWLNWAAQQRRKFKGTLADMETRNEMNQHKIGYEIGAYAVHQLTQENGLKSLAEYWRAIGGGTSWDSALKQAFGRTKDEIYSTY